MSSEIKLPGSNAPKDIFELWKAKLSEGFLPPDPVELVDFLGRTFAELEHSTILLPLAEYMEVNFGTKITDSLPRLPNTATFPDVEFLKYKKAPGEIQVKA
jgi:hypothetical protein